jgi:hypothetical protein
MRATTRATLVALTVAASIAGTTTSALADNTVTQEVTAGTRSASIADVALDAVSYSHSDQLQSGTLVLSADDSTGSDAGWNVTVQTSAFTRAGGGSVPAANFVLGTPATPSMTAGQAVDGTDGPLAGVGGGLDSARKVVFANEGFGKGTYTQDLPVSLTVPGQSLAGTYSATLTVTISAGPGA